jgi:hypothetical protein
MSNKYNLKVGQKLWYVPSYSRHKPGEITIKKVGRLYFESENLKFNLESLTPQNDCAYGQCYLTEQDYLDVLTVKQMRAALHYRLDPNYSRLEKDFTLDQLQRVTAILDNNKS